MTAVDVRSCSLLVAFVLLLTGCEELEKMQAREDARPMGERCLQRYQLALAAHCTRAGRDADIACIRLMQADRDRCLELAGTARTLQPAPALGPVVGEELAGVVHFEVGSADLVPSEQAELARIAALLQSADPSRAVELRGHADPTGPDATNERLSQARALAVHAALVARGVDPARMSGGGFGDLEPAAPITTDAGRRESRRVEVVLLPPPRAGNAP